MVSTRVCPGSNRPVRGPSIDAFLARVQGASGSAVVPVVRQYLGDVRAHLRELQDSGAGGGELEHLLVRDGIELAGLRHEPRVGGEDTVDVGEDVAHRGRQRRRERKTTAASAGRASSGDPAAAHTGNPRRNPPP